MAQLQVRQIDRERNVAGTDPAELLAINTDLAIARSIAQRLADLPDKQPSQLTAEPEAKGAQPRKRLPPQKATPGPFRAPSESPAAGSLDSDCPRCSPGEIRAVLRVSMPIAKAGRWLRIERMRPSDIGRVYRDSLIFVLSSPASRYSRWHALQVRRYCSFFSSRFCQSHNQSCCSGNAFSIE